MGYVNYRDEKLKTDVAAIRRIAIIRWINKTVISSAFCEKSHNQTLASFSEHVFYEISQSLKNNSFDMTTVTYSSIDLLIGKIVNP